MDGASSRPGAASSASQDRASASGSVILSQILGAAALMGHGDVAVPELPTARLAAENPLRAAILEWVATTGAIVPPSELATELLRADAMPLDVQRDIALLLLATSDATLLQRAALAELTTEEIEWIYTHPEVAEDLAQGIDTPETRRMAGLAALVDMKKSVAASLLVLQAVEATRGSLSAEQAAGAVGKLTPGQLDATTIQVLQLLATAQTGASDQEKVLFAAKLVALASGVQVPSAGPAPSFEDALRSLLAASAQAPEADAVAGVVARAHALPDDLEGAIARLIQAQAIAIRAADPATITPTSQPQALAAVLVATAEALPILEKYGYYWRAAPDALRVAEWEPETRVGWAAHHAALVATARHDIADLAAVAPLLSGHELAVGGQVPPRSFTDAYLAVSKEAGTRVNASMLAEIAAAEATLDPAVRDAAAILMSGAAESARLQRLAFAGLSAEEERFLRFETRGLDALYTSSQLSAEDLARLERATSLALRVDAQQLANAGLVATRATAEAHALLEGRDAFSTQSAVTHVTTGMRAFLGRFLPIQPASAQGTQTCTSSFVVDACSGQDGDVVLRIRYGTVLTEDFTPGEYVAYQQMCSDQACSAGGDNPPNTANQVFTCDESECVVYDPDGAFSFQTNTYTPGTPGEATRDLLVITGTEGGSYRPETTARKVCTAQHSAGAIRPGPTCRMETAFRYGAATVHLDLGGDDTYQLPVAMVHANATLPVSLHLDIGGNDRYNDPTGLYDVRSPILRDLGVNAGHPSQASAVYGGVAVLVDAQGADLYDASSRSQGFGRLGLALLADLSAGKDQYRSREFSQGASSETFTLGGGLFIERGGPDEYTARTGQGFGLGAVFLDLGGEDIYRNEKTPFGAPVVHLEVLPGGDITTLDERRDNRIWIDGPGTLSVGIGIDQELILTTGDDDGDDYADVVEFVVGTDPEDDDSTPRDAPLTRAALLAADTDSDGYPDYIERALSTDADDPTSYPAGFPAGVAVIIPAAVTDTIPQTTREFLGITGGRVEPFATNSTAGSNLTGSDKVIDLRLPLQDAGTLDYACTGESYLNASAPFGLFPGDNILLPVNETFSGPNDASEDPVTGGAPRYADGGVIERCVRASYDTTQPGQGNATVPTSDTSDRRGSEFTFRMPAGILAVGDVVSTTYRDDYFVVIDLGGSDKFLNGAGGALLVQTSPRFAEGVSSCAEAEDEDACDRVNNTFVAPSLVVSIDVTEATGGLVDAGAARDEYLAGDRDFAHGSYFGVLVDTGGRDVYEARHGSQGAIGGILLDLDLGDTYRAGDLSQGAGLTSMPSGARDDGAGNADTHTVNGLPAGGALPSDRAASVSAETGWTRRALPGFLLDLSDASSASQDQADHANTFLAGSHSQGFARGFQDAVVGTDDTAPAAYGILASLGDNMNTYTATGRHSQAVAGVDGVALLVDRAGVDKYRSSSKFSHGWTISQTVRTEEAEMNGNVPHTALAILADLGSIDDYCFTTNCAASTKRTDRQDQVTVTRAQSATASAAAPVFYGDQGIHLDTDASQPGSALNGLFGTGGASFASAGPVGTATEAFHVYMPTARLAIGKNATTVYDREFAFVVDLGGDNVYNHSAGGLVRDYLVVRDAQGDASTGGASAVYDAGLTLFPVSVVVDAGLGNSQYNSAATFAQGAGLFSVGIVADLGGRDAFKAREREVESRGSEWTSLAPIIDGTIGTDWDGIAARPITLRSLDDPRFEETWQLRLANDDRAVYLALSGKTTSADEAAHRRDTLSINFDMGYAHQEWNYATNTTGVDRAWITFHNNTGECVAQDWAFVNPYLDSMYDSKNKGWRQDSVPDRSLTVGCRYTDAGEVFYEIKKDLLPGVPYDFRDLAYYYDPVVGFGIDRNGSAPVFPGNLLGLQLEFGDAGAGFYQGASGAACGQGDTDGCHLQSPFTWPPGSVDDDGANGHRRTLNLSDEMANWAAVGLAQLGKDATSPRNVQAPALSQGVGLAGVGIVALLGSTGAESRMVAGDQAQGYGAFSGLGVVIDTAGSDVYESRSRSLGAAETRGFGLFLDLEGNDQYVSYNESLGWSRALPADTVTAAASIGTSAAFFDLSGEDKYVHRPGQYSQRIDAARGFEQGAEEFAPAYNNNVAWVQNQSVGADFRLFDAVREKLAATLAETLYNASATNLTMNEFDAANPTSGHWGNGCTDRVLPSEGNQPVDYRASGTVCFVAAVDTGGIAQTSVGSTYNTTNATLSPPGGRSVESLLSSINNDTNASSGFTPDRVDVLSVDFLIDRAAVTTTYAKRQHTAHLTTWAAPVNLSDVSDGVVRAKARPLYAAETPATGAFLFYGHVTNAVNETFGTRVLIIDNPPVPSIGLAPPYTGIASATYSPYAVGSQQKLTVDFSVNHDVGEDRLAAAHGWRPNVTNTSIPCLGIPAGQAQDVRLCNVLPFYLGKSGEQPTTEPGTNPAYSPASLVHESIGGSRYTSALPMLTTPLVITGDESFHLAIPGRTSLLPHQNYSTSIKLLVTGPNGDVRDANGTLWYLANVTRTAPAALNGVGGLPVPVSPPGIPQGVYGVIGTTEALANTVVGLLQGNALANAVQVVYDASCESPTSTQCGVLEGNPGVGRDVRPCAATPPSNNALGALAWTAVNTAPAVRGTVCQRFQDDLEDAAEVGAATDIVTSAVAGVVETAVQGASDALAAATLGQIATNGTGRIAGVNFTDFYFTVNKTSMPVGNHCATVGGSTQCIGFDPAGNLVLPAGFQIKIEFQLNSTDSCVLSVCNLVAGATGQVATSFIETVDFANSTTNSAVDAAHGASGSEALDRDVDLYNPANLRGFDPLRQTVEKTIRDTDGRGVGSAARGELVPSSYYFVKSGAPNEQPRLSIRVPAEPSTSATITVERATTAETVLTLRSGGAIVGDIPGTPTRDGGYINTSKWLATSEPMHIEWNVTTSAPRWTRNTQTYDQAGELLDGLYFVHVTATDARGQPTTRTDTLLVDSTAPVTAVETDIYAGKGILSGSAIPVRWSVFEAGAGLNGTYLFVRNGTAGDIADISTWQFIEEPFPRSVRDYPKSKNAGINTYLFVTVAVDRAGNVEGYVASPDDETPDTVRDAVRAAFAAKVARGANAPGGFTRILLDEGDPRFTDRWVTGGRNLIFQGSNFTFVRAGAPVEFGICAKDAEDQIGVVNLSLDHVDPLTGTLKSVTFTAARADTNEGCEPGSARFVSAQWHLTNADQTKFPAGVWAAMFEVFDRANNRIRVPAGNLILDHDAPEVRVEPPVLPPGQTAVKPGDHVLIRVIATDDFGVDEDRITVDASKFAKNASALKTRAVRVNGVIYQQANFTVDLPGITNGVFDVAVHVPDLAGNATVIKTPIAVNFKPFDFVAGSLRVSNVTHNALTLHWRTNEPTSALAKFGVSSNALTGRTPQDLNATIDHALRVEGLSPSTRYFLRAVAVSAGGSTKESDILEVETRSALFLAPISPVSSAKVSGVVPIKFRGGLFDSTDFVSYTLEVRDGPTKPWSFITTATRQGERHELTWNSTRFLDGSAYELRLTAKAGRDEAAIVIDRLMSDNTPASVLVLSPLLATNDTTPQLTAEASDALSGLVQGPAELLVDGVPVVGNVTYEHLSAGRLRFGHQFLSPLEPGVRTFELRVSDLAGNVAKETWKVAIDGDAPSVTVNPTRFSPGVSAAKRGGTVTLNLSITDLSGVSMVTADASSLNPTATDLRLVKIINADVWQVTIPVTAGDGMADKVIALRAVDLAGNTARLTTNLTLDNLAPSVAATSIAEALHRRAAINVPANEPILVNGTATAPNSPAITAATRDPASQARLVFDGLLPSRTYQFKLTALDRAGNPVDLAGSFETQKDLVAPGDVRQVSVLDLLNGTLRLSWPEAKDDVLVSHYRVYRSDDGVTFAVHAQTPDTTFEDSNLPYERSYVYKVAAVDHGSNEGLASPALRASATAVPHLSAGSVTPTVGTASTTFRYTVTYLSPGGIPPAYVRVILDGVPQNMTIQPGGDVKTGAIYAYETRLAPHTRDAPHSYSFEASDGRYTAAFPLDGSEVRGPLVSGDALAGDDVSGLAAFAQRVPLGGVAGLALAMLAAVGVAALLRRKKEGSK